MHYKMQYTTVNTDNTLRMYSVVLVFKNTFTGFVNVTSSLESVLLKKTSAMLSVDCPLTDKLYIKHQSFHTHVISSHAKCTEWQQTHHCYFQNWWNKLAYNKLEIIMTDQYSTKVWKKLTLTQQPSVIEPSTLVIWISKECILHQVKFYTYNEHGHIKELIPLIQVHRYHMTDIWGYWNKNTESTMHFYRLPSTGVHKLQLIWK